jgi:hypothetical protein
MIYSQGQTDTPEKRKRKQKRTSLHDLPSRTDRHLSHKTGRERKRGEKKKEKQRQPTAASHHIGV